jgi:hypothetical protein
MDAVLASVKEQPGAVVVGGDLNTTGTDAAPTSIRREITRRASSLKFWLGMTIRYLSPVALPQLGFAPANHFKNYLDPSAFHLPIFLPNRESRLFTKCSDSGLRTVARSTSAVLRIEPATGGLGRSPTATKGTSRVFSRPSHSSERSEASWAGTSWTGCSSSRSVLAKWLLIFQRR